MKALASEVPYLRGEQSTIGPSIMLFRSLRHARLRSKTGTKTRLKIPEGHFSTRFFLRSVSSQRIVANVYGDNLQKHSDRFRVDAAINTISCPDRHEADLISLSAFLAEQPHMPVINNPAAVLRTGRADMAAMIADLPNLYVPRTRRITMPEKIDQALLANAVRDIGLPVILRKAGTHTGQSMALIRSTDQLASFAAALSPGDTIYATRFVDPRGEGRLFTKYRGFFIDGQFYPVARLVSNSWNVHSGDRYRVMFAMNSAQDRERAYLSNPERVLGTDVMKALHELPSRVGLDFFGIDFSQMPDRSLVVFEVNAVMRHNYDHARTFPYTRENLDRISQAFDAMVEKRMRSVPI
ncbi:MAG: hypothetical protein AAGD13_23705 [Pseudomonadota bacterium]